MSRDRWMRRDCQRTARVPQRVAAAQHYDDLMRRRIAEQRNRVRVNGDAIELGRTNIAAPLFRIRKSRIGDGVHRSDDRDQKNSFFDLEFTHLEV
jgi:hypothetical protein